MCERELEEARSLSIDDPSVQHAHQRYLAGVEAMAEAAAWLRDALYEGTPGSLERGRQALLDGAAEVQAAQRTVAP